MNEMVTGMMIKNKQKILIKKTRSIMPKHNEPINFAGVILGVYKGSSTW